MAADVVVHNTAFALGIATHVAVEAGLPVLFFSLEMGHAELTLRILSAEARVDSQKMRTGRLSEQDWSKIGTRHRPARGAAVHRRQPERHGHGDPGQVRGAWPSATVSSASSWSTTCSS